MSTHLYKLGIDIGSTTVKVALLNEEDELLFADYKRHFANIRETLTDLLTAAREAHGDLSVAPMITGSGGLTLAKHLDIPFVQEVISVSTALTHYAPQTDVAIELGGEDAKIIYFEGGNVEQRMNGICAGGTGSFIDQMAPSFRPMPAVSTNMPKTIKRSIPSQPAAVCLPKQISSLSLTKERPRKICPPPFSRR